MASIYAAQHQTHACLLQLTTAKCNGLIGEAQRIPHGASGCARKQLQSHRLCRQILLRQDLRQMFKDSFWRHRTQIKLQTTRQNGDWYFLRIGGGQDKLEVFGRLFQGLQHGIECRVGQHVNLVNHENFESALYRLVNRLL